ncbi:HDOD domain-containing protein [Thioalkalivibrio sp. ALJT]|uniref:HDOD domain-containing protein n=1 Tax=Thioalkalivibrio sp. ALJT TaxID=1158146 RepID=UPI0003676508|nr:HDOD domain-containing protein [Thioalkalivibrio sp. ALJT]
MTNVNTVMQGLPSLPRALTAVLDATRANEADFQPLTRAIEQDADISSRLLQAANSPFYSRGSPCRTIDRALFSLGLDTVRSLALTAAIQPLFGAFRMRHRAYLRSVWQRALTCAGLARSLATLTRYRHPEEAYLAGLLIDIGRLVRLTQDEGHYWPLLQTAVDDWHLMAIEQETYGRHYGELGGDCLAAWGLGPPLADAVRGHLDPVSRVCKGHHLVKLVNLAHTLGCLPTTLSPTAEPECNEVALAAADTLFGLNEGLTRELRSRADHDIRRMAGALEIDLPAGTTAAAPVAGTHDCAQGDAGDLRVHDVSEPNRSDVGGAQTAGLRARCLSARRALSLTFGVRHSLLFLADADQQAVCTWVEGQETPALTLPLLPGRSLVTDTLLDRATLRHEVTRADRLPPIDQQLLRLCQAERLWSYPLLADSGRPSGVLILGLSEHEAEHLQARRDFIPALTGEIARALTGTPRGAASRSIHAQGHAAGTPIELIRNYLNVLHRGLDPDTEARLEPDLVKAEIDHVGRILLRLRDPDATPGEDRGPASLNALVRQIADIVDTSLCRTRNIRLYLDLSPADPPLTVPANHLRQILTNLLKNAAEAQPRGGEIIVATQAPTTIGGNRMVPLSVADRGPGLPPEVQAAAVTPAASTKGSGYSGHGLSIVKRLSEEVRAQLSFTSTSVGTRFDLALPASPTEPTRP